MVSYKAVNKGSRFDKAQDLVSLLIQRVWTASTSAIPGQSFQEYDTIHSTEYVRSYGYFFYAPFNKFVDNSFRSPIPSIRGFRDFVFWHQRSSLYFQIIFVAFVLLLIYIYIFGINVAYSHDLIPLSTLESSLLAINMLPDKNFALPTPESCRRILRNLRPVGDCAIALFHYDERVSPKPANVLHSFLASHAHTHL